MSRLTGVIVMLVLSGSPAAIVACLASCLETRSAHADAPPASRPHCESAAVVTDTAIAAAGRTDRHAVNALQVAASTEVVVLHAVERQVSPPASNVAISPPPPVSATVPLRI